MDAANNDQKIGIGPKFLTRFEYARILGARALQISMGAPILVETIENNPKESTNKAEKEQGDPLLISEREIKQRLLPILIRRTLPDGKYQDIPLSYLLADMGRKQKGIIIN